MEQLMPEIKKTPNSKIMDSIKNKYRLKRNRIKKLNLLNLESSENKKNKDIDDSDNNDNNFLSDVDKINEDINI